MIIMAIDAATMSGVAVGPPSAPPEISRFYCGGKFQEDGAIMPKIEGLKDFEILANFNRHLMRLLFEHEPTHFFAERQLPSGGLQSNFATHTILSAMVVQGCALAVQCGVPPQNVRLVAPVSVRKYTLGVAYPKAPKEAVKRRCRQLGWKAEDDNAADAAMMWAYAGSRLDPAGALPLPPVDFPIARKPPKKGSKAEAMAALNAEIENAGSQPDLQDHPDQDGERYAIQEDDFIPEFD